MRDLVDAIIFNIVLIVVFLFGGPRFCGFKLNRGRLRGL